MTEQRYADVFIDYRPNDASLIGVDDFRPFAVDITTEDNEQKTYRFPDIWAAREFVNNEVL